MIRHVHGNILDAQTEAITNTVNCVGVMGKGLALQFRQRYPEMFEHYAVACKLGKLQPGVIWAYGTGGQPKIIFNFPTKRHWKDPSRIEDIRLGLEHFPATIRAFGVRSVAIPPLGCGCGGLDWTGQVHPMVLKVFENTEIEVHLYGD